MSVARIVAAGTAVVLLLFAVHTLILSYQESQRHYGSSLWFDKDAGRSDAASNANNREFLIGVGKADITGPVVELNLMGYANTSQLGSGLRQRIYSRAFIVGEPDVPENRWIYLVLDTQSGDTAIRHGILEGLRNLGPEYAMYTASNVAVTGTHSHSGPGAWLNYLLPQITSRGFSKESYDAIVQGTLLSIKRAHESVKLGSITVGKTRIEDANINRSLYAYLANPAEERARYQDDVDKDLTLLRFTRASDNKDIGVLTWFAVHGTSMLGNNTLISGDNKGVAAYLFEREMRRSSNAAENFIAGFSQANVGDTTPNVMGAYCESGVDEGKECKLEDSTCGGKSQPCHGRGPFYGLDDTGTKSCFEIGRRQFAGAHELYSSLSRNASAARITGSAVRSFHTFTDLSNYTFAHPNGTFVRTCPAALGYGFAAGTSDGPGAFDFKQNASHSPNASPVWAVVGGLLHAPDDQQKACQYPKPILLDVGETMRPYDWAPNIVDIQMMRVGNFIIIVSPGEATTMAGRRWREAIHASAQTSLLTDAKGGLVEEEPLVILGGPANTYTHYIATEEEYSVQRYEGASTLYGPHTLNAYINLTLTYLPYLSATPPKAKLDPGPQPQINTNRSLSFITGVVVDNPPLFKKFGDVIDDVKTSYTLGGRVQVRFVGANPRNDLRLEGSYVVVEKQMVAPSLASKAAPTVAPTEAPMVGEELKPRKEEWVRYRSDEDWELIFHWERTSTLLGTSEVRVEWEIPAVGGSGSDEEDVKGRYRIRYFGDAKSIGGKISGFEGVSGEFEVV